MRYPAKSKKKAIGLWFAGIFDALNVHNFYLGRIQLGVFKLLLYFASFAAWRSLAESNPALANAALAVNAAVLFWNVVDLVQIIRLPSKEFGKSAQPGLSAFGASHSRLIAACLNDDAHKAMKALAYLDAPLHLAYVAQAAPLNDTKLKAVEKLSDQNLLKKIALDSTDSMVRQAAARKLTDKAALSQVAEQAGYDESLKTCALLALGDEASLLRVLTIKRGYPTIPILSRP